MSNENPTLGDYLYIGMVAAALLIIQITPLLLMLLLYLGGLALLIAAFPFVCLAGLVIGFVLAIVR